jgi:hypothetical protein
MKTRPTVNRILLLLAVAVVICSALVLSSDSNRGNKVSAAPDANEHGTTPTVTFNRDGELVRPTGYRKWIHVGTPLTPHDMNNGKAAFPEFHSVYIDPNSYDHFGKTGEFPDGTVLIKELVSVGTKQATSGNGYFMGEFTGLEVLLKDKHRFKGEPGNWGFFSFGHEYPLKPTTKIQPTANCNACHGGAADDDYVFTQYYPVLRAAKKAAR